MEHLPLVKGARKPSLSIPFVVKSASGSPYTHGEDDFISFAADHLSEIRFIYPNLGPQDCLLSLAQSWLFFGTLSEFFCESIHSDIFTQMDHDTGHRVICTSGVHQLRARWIASLPRRSLISLGFRQMVVRKRGIVIARATWAYEQLQDMVDMDDPRARLVMFSIKLMLCSLCHTARTVLSPTPTLDALLSRLSFRPVVAGDTATTDFLLWDYMVQNKWCPYQINQLLLSYSATSMVYLSSITRMERKIGHQDCLKKGRCMASQIDWDAFVPLHAADGCTCGYVSVDEDEIMAKLEKDEIPLLSCSRSASGDFHIKVIPADTRTLFRTPTLYYAVSHVRPASIIL